MIGIIIVAIVIVLVFALIIKGYKPQAVLLFGGMVMLASAIIIGMPILTAKESVGFAWFDIFKIIETTMSAQMAGLGLLIMSVGGYVRYMNDIGANKTLVALAVKPLRFVSSPYIVLVIAFILTWLLLIATVSASGLGMMLMATLYPIMLGLGISPGAAVAVIVTGTFMNIGPASSVTLFASKLVGVDPVTYFIHYQLVMAIPAVVLVAILHYFTQKWFDRKEGHIIEKINVVEVNSKDEIKAPTFYALLPLLPLLLTMVFSSFTGSKIKMSITSAVLIGLLITMVIEFIRCRDFKKVAASIKTFFEGMGASFASVVSIIIAAGVLVAGFNALVSISSMVTGLKSAGVGPNLMILVMQTIVVLFSMVADGVVTFFSFGTFVPQIAQHMGIAPVHMLLPMEFMSGFIRSVTPVSEAMIAIVGMSGLSTVDVSKRTIIPIAGAIILVTVLNFAIF